MATLGQRGSVCLVTVFLMYLTSTAAIGIAAEPPATNTTTVKPPPTNTTTVKLPATNTTTVKPPPTNTTTVKPPATNTTTVKLPATTITTVKLPATAITTVKPPATTTTTVKLPATTITTVKPPATTITTVKLPATATTTVKPPATTTTTVKLPATTITTVKPPATTITTVKLPATATTTVHVVVTNITTHEAQTSSQTPSAASAATSPLTAAANKTGMVSIQAPASSQVVVTGTQDLGSCQGVDCNNGTCQTAGGSNYTCLCHDGWTGPNCTDVDYCYQVTCEHNSTCYISGDHYNCSCLPGWQGQNCQQVKDYCQPNPCTHNGSCTQDLTLSEDYFKCDCKPGFTGPTCSEDVLECQNATICGHGLCIETMGSYECWCLEGWSGRNCESDLDECNDLSSCPAYHTCNNTHGSVECTCADPLHNFDNLCQKTVLWPDFKSGVEFTGKPFYNAITTIPFPYYETASREFFVFQYGYVAVSGYISSPHAPYVPSQWPFATKLFGVYWADIEATNSSGRPSHFYVSVDEGRLTNLSHSSSLVQYVRAAVNDSRFEPLSILAATWVNAAPSPAKTFPYDRATFQLVLATDSHVTYALSSYRTVWSNTNGYQRPFVQTIYSLYNGVQNNEIKPGNMTGPVKVKLGDAEPNNASHDCVETAQNVRVRFAGDLQTLPACPCYQIQAANDDMFEESESHPACYQSITTSSGNSLYQLCCFDEHGFLLNFTKEALVPQPTNSADLSLQQAHDQCCADGSTLCDWFYTQMTSPGCHKYVPPFVGGGFGDPHIITFDGNKYSFNGQGDYVIFQSGNTELQGRTEVSDNNQTTLFVAYVLKVGNETYQFQRKDDMVLYINGTTNKTVSEKKVITPDCIIKVTNVNGTLSYGIRLLAKPQVDSRGLLGVADRNASHDFLFGDGTFKEGTVANLTVDDISKFGESWKATPSFLQGNASSKAYNHVVIENTPEAVLSQILVTWNTTGHDEANSICGGELFCLQDYYINGDRQSALDTLHQATAISNKQHILNELPTFDNRETRIEVNTSSPLNLTLTATSQSESAFSLSTSLPYLSGLILVKQNFTWNISADLAALRNITYPQDLVLLVTNNNGAAEFAPIILLCLCQDPKQCVVKPPIYSYGDSSGREYLLTGDGTKKGNVGSWMCDCQGRAEGEFCDRTIDACNNCFVKNESLCDTTLEDYCPPCPSGYRGNTFLCPDVNECENNNGRCEHICKNTDGSYQCLCHDGYRLGDDGISCHDINECLVVTQCADPNKICRDVPGTFHCICYPGLEGNDTCIRAPLKYYGSLGMVAYKDQAMSYPLLVKSSPEYQALAHKVATSITKALSPILSQSEVYVEVLSFENSTTTISPQRGPEVYTLVDFLIHSSNLSVTANDINSALTDELHGCKTNCRFGDLLLFPTKFPAVDGNVDLCSREEFHHCDLLTADCYTDYDSPITECNCKKGYTMYEMNFYSCYDVNECEQNSTLCGPKQDSCHNLPGTYQCSCDKGTFWNSSVMKCVGDICSTNPCDNDGVCHISNNDQGFVCSCNYGWNGPVCADEDTDARRMKIAVICVSAILGFCCLALFVIVIVVCLKQRKILKNVSESGGGYSEITSTYHPKASHKSSNEMEENGRGNVYTYPSFDRSGDKRTSFHSPVPESKKEESSSTYYNKAFEEEVARL